MENPIKSGSRIHPLTAAAAVSVMLVSLIGVAAITGILPNSHSSNAPQVAPQALVAADDKVADDVPKPIPAPHRRIHHAPILPPTHVAQIAQAAPAGEPARPAVCGNCGRIESIQAIKHEPPQTSGLGVAAGAVLGGLLGHQVGGGNGNKLATVAGAVGGGFAGNAVERQTRTTTTYQVRVHMEDGSTRTFPYNEAPSWSTGEPVQVVNGSLSARG